MRKIIIAFLIIISGCEFWVDPKGAVYNYRCTEEQLRMVDIEYEICIKSVVTTDCFRSAKRSQCEYIGPEIKEQ
jgi:hypothetical protein